MRYETFDRIFNVLKQHPQGATVKQVAAELNSNPANVGSRMSKLAAYDFLSRTPFSNGKAREYRYRIKQREPA